MYAIRSYYVDFDARRKAMLMALIDLNGGREVLVEARKQLRDAPAAVEAALANLETVM